MASSTPTCHHPRIFDKSKQHTDPTIRRWLPGACSLSSIPVIPRISKDLLNQNQQNKMPCEMHLMCICIYIVCIIMYYSGASLLFWRTKRGITWMMLFNHTSQSCRPPLPGHFLCPFWHSGAFCCFKHHEWLVTTTHSCMEVWARE